MRKGCSGFKFGVSRFTKPQIWFLISVWNVNIVRNVSTIMHSSITIKLTQLHPARYLTGHFALKSHKEVTIRRLEDDAWCTLCIIKINGNKQCELLINERRLFMLCYCQRFKIPIIIYLGINNITETTLNKIVEER